MPSQKVEDCLFTFKFSKQYCQLFFFTIVRFMVLVRGCQVVGSVRT